MTRECSYSSQPALDIAIKFEWDRSSSNLKLIVEIDDEEEEEALSHCDKADTMARVGARKDASFIIIAEED